LGDVRSHHAPQAQLAAILGGEHDIGALDAPEFVQDRAGAPPEPRPLLPLLQGFPQDVGEETDEDVGVHPVGALMPDRADTQFALLNAEGRFGVRQLDVGPPQVLGTPVGDVGTQHVAALAPAGPVIPLRPRCPREPQAGGTVGSVTKSMT